MFKYGGVTIKIRISTSASLAMCRHTLATPCNTLIITTPQHYLLISNIDDI